MGTSCLLIICLFTEGGSYIVHLMRSRNTLETHLWGHGREGVSRLG